MAGCIALGLGSQAQSQADIPRRVVSMNLCTDQLAMMLAAPGQLVSISYVALDPRSSAMATQARNYPVNHGLAEEIYRLKPDLVLAGTYTTRATVEMLGRLGVPVVQFDPENDFDGIRANILNMGEALGRKAEAYRMVAAFDRNLAELRDSPDHQPRAALYYANGYTAGDRTLAGQIIAAAGLHNIAADAGLTAGGTLSLEQLVLADPELLIRGQRHDRASRAEEILDHPAVAVLAMQAEVATIADADWVCGTPYVLNAITRLRDARNTWEQAGQR